MKPKISANERRLAKMLRECGLRPTYEESAAFLAKRGVRVIPRHERAFVDNYLQRMARVK